MNHVERALEAYRLERDYGHDHARAFTAAVTAVQGAIENDLIARVRNDMMEEAERLDNDEDDVFWDDGPGALLMFAYGLDERLPPEQRKDCSGSRNG